MANYRGNRNGGRSYGGDRNDSHPDRQDETRRYGNRQGYGQGGGYQGGGRGGGQRREGPAFLFQHKQEPVQYADNGYNVVSSYAFGSSQKFPEPRAFIDIRDFFVAQRENGAEFLCATSRGCKIPIEQARDLLAALAAEISWVEATHPELCFRGEDPNGSEPDPFDQQPNEVPF